MAMTSRSTAFLIVIFFAIPFLIVPTQAYSANRDYFQAGVKYFKAGRYRQAIHAFEKARKRDTNNPKLDYNLGVSYFKTGQFGKAKKYLSRSARHPLYRSLSHYNLGLLAKKQNKRTEAVNWFNKVIQKNDDKKLTILAKKQISELTGKRKNWYLSASAGYGYDSNINSVPTGQATNLGDNFIESFASANGMINGNQNRGWFLDSFVYRLDYQDLSDNDFDDLQIGIYYKTPVDKWRTRFGAYLDKSYLNGDAYQNTTGLEARGQFPIGQSSRLQLRYLYNDINPQNRLYNYLAGWKQRFRAEYRNYKGKDFYRAYYELELNDRADTTTRSYSPTRHTLRGRYQHRFNKNWKWYADASYRISDYPMVAGLGREDKRLKLSTSVFYKLNKHWKIKAKYERTNNNSNDTLYDYVRNMYMLSVNWIY